MSGMTGVWALILRWVISLIGFMVLVAIASGSLPWIRRKLSPHPSRAHSMILRNRSNFPCSFEVGISVDEPALSGEVFWMGSPLPKARVTRRGKITRGSDSLSAGVAAAGKKGSGPNLSKAKSKLTILSPIIGILSGIGGLIPGSIGTSMKETANSLRQSQMDARIAMDAPEMAKKQVDAISSQSAKVMGKNQSAPTSKDQSDQSSIVTSAPIKQEQPREEVIEYEEELPDHFVTKPVGEGEEIKIDLRLNWAKDEWKPFSKVYRVSIAQKGIGVEVTPPAAMEHEGFAAFSATRFLSYLAARFAQALLIVFLLTLQAGLLFWVWMA